MNISSVAANHGRAAAQEGASIQVLKKTQNQQKLEGQAAVALIETAGSVAPEPVRAAGSPSCCVDVYA